jgi:hypothetical protein
MQRAANAKAETARSGVEAELVVRLNVKMKMADVADAEADAPPSSSPPSRSGTLPLLLLHRWPGT